METVSIGFSYHKTSCVSKLIKSIEGSPYSHVYIRRKSKYGEYVYQASGLAVNFMNIDIFLDHNVIVEEYEFDLDDVKREKLLTKFIEFAGAGYATSALFQLLFILGCERVSINIEIKGDGASKTSKFICSELGAFICREILEIPIAGDLDFITPKKLNPIIRQYGRRTL